MEEPEKTPEPEQDSEQDAVREDLARHLGISGDRFEIVRLPLADWPDGIVVLYALRKERHGRIFYHYVCYEGEIYSPLAPDGLERLLKRMLASRRFRPRLCATRKIQPLMLVRGLPSRRCRKSDRKTS